MKEERGKWEDIIRSKIYDFESDTNPDDWDIISAKVSGGKTVRFNPYRTYNYIAAAAAVAVLLTVGGIYFYSDNDKASDQIVVVEESTQYAAGGSEDIVEKAVNPVDKSEGYVEKPVDNHTEDASDHSSKSSVKEERRGREVKSELLEEPPVRMRLLSVGDSHPVIKNIPDPDPDIKTIEKEILYGYQKIKPEEMVSEKSLFAETSPEIGIKRRRWGFGMGGGGYAVNSTSGSFGVEPYSGLLNNSDEYMFGGNIIKLRNFVLKSDKHTDEVNDYDSDDLPGKVKYKAPVSGGLGVSYFLTDRWALQSGVVYTLLRSEGRYYDNKGNIADWKQNLHYMGVPLSISYKIAEWNRFQFYASAGGMYEFNVAGKLKKTVTVENLKAKESENVRMKTPLWSVNTRAGTAYPIWRFINVYAEAGASYYFDNGSEIETIRSDKPFNVSLQAGIRLGF
ncbi:MAG: PorT family protein [Tannerella sp.]|jgi:outer membrane protein W|nr:PorT family protein [Tannerella sp.]